MTLYFAQFLDLLVIVGAGLAAAIVFSPFAIWIARRVGLMDIPGVAAHKQHTRPTPLAGGIAVALCLVLLLTIFGMWQSPYVAILAAIAIILVFGLWDDARRLSPLQKVLGQVLASLVMIASGNYIKFLSGLHLHISSEEVITLLNWLITILWLVGITNAINLIDSMDGQALGFSAIAFGFFIGFCLVAEQASLARFCCILLGMCMGLFIFNISPAKLFLGDSGSQTLGFILASVAFLYTPHEFPQASSWFVPILALGVPIFDTTLVVLSRMRDHRNILRADRSHIYHRLVALGLDPARSVLLILIVSLALNLLAFFSLYLVPWQANLVFGLTVAVGVLLLVLLLRKSHTQGE